MKDSELLREIKAGEELERRGWKKLPCLSCEGNGYISDPNTVQFFSNPCPTCAGKGYKWEPPIEKRV